MGVTRLESLLRDRMPVSDDDYKRRLAQRIMSGTGSLGPNISPSMMPYQATATVPSLRVTLTNPSKDMPQFMPGPVGAAGIGRVGVAAAEEFVPRATVAALKSKPLQETLDIIDEYGRGIVADETFGLGTLKYDALPRYGSAARGRFIDFLNEHLATGEMTVRDANRFVKAMPHYLEDNAVGFWDELVGGDSKALIRMSDQSKQAVKDIMDAKITPMVRKWQHPEEKSQYLLGKLWEAQNDIFKIVDEWH
mgnify:CR=1 FL=1